MPRTSPHAGPGPARTSSSSSCGAPHGATAAIGMGSAGSGPTASTSPARSRAGPIAESTSVERDPSTDAPANPPRTARYARAPWAYHSKCSSAPAGHGCASYGSTSCPARRIGPQAPVTANHRSRSATARNPPIVASTTAAASGLPTSRFAVRAAPRSRAPDAATPSDAAPGRPRSCRVARSPGSTMRRPACGSGSPGCEPSSRGVVAEGRSTGAVVTARKRTRAPGARSAGEAASGSNSGASVVPMSRHPPGVSRG